MKSKFILCSLLTLSIAFTSCKNEEETAEAAKTGTPQEPLIVPRVQPIPSENYVQPNQQVPMPQGSTTTAQVTPQAPTKAGMNPPHGQPGHRCDIAVGAPLSTPVAKAAKPTTITTGKPTYTTTTIPTPTTNTTSGTPAILSSDAPPATAPGMNPPHGQPGHVCGTPVGDPLPKS